MPIRDDRKVYHVLDIGTVVCFGPLHQWTGRIEGIKIGAGHVVRYDIGAWIDEQYTHWSFGAEELERDPTEGPELIALVAHAISENPKLPRKFRLEEVIDEPPTPPRRRKATKRTQKDK